MEPILVITHDADDPGLATALEILRAQTSVEVASADNPGELDGILHRAGSRPVVIAGGDGSLHTVISALHRRNDLSSTVLGLLPLGTGNDFARSVGLPLDPAEAAEALLAGRPHKMDLLVDEVGEVVVNSVHLGTGAEAAKAGSGWKERLGKIGYPLGALQTALKPPVLRLRVEVDDQVVCDYDEPVLQVAVGNGATVGGGTPLTPDAAPDDGRADVLVWLATTPVARLGYAAALLRGRHPERDDVRTATGTRITVSGERFWCSADGELYGPERHRAWHVEPAAYSLLVP